jgi:hypothetical protein
MIMEMLTYKSPNKALSFGKGWDSKKENDPMTFPKGRNH